MEEKEVIDVVAEGMTFDEKEKPVQAAKIKDDHRKGIRFFGRLSSLLLGIASPGFFLSLVASLVFSILYSEATDNTVRFVMMIICWSLVGLFVILFAVGFLARLFMRRLKEKDPNFEHMVDSDGIYE